MNGKGTENVNGKCERKMRTENANGKGEWKRLTEIVIGKGNFTEEGKIRYTIMLSLKKIQELKSYFIQHNY